MLYFGTLKRKADSVEEYSVVYCVKRGLCLDSVTCRLSTHTVCIGQSQISTMDSDQRSPQIGISSTMASSSGNSHQRCGHIVYRLVLSLRHRDIQNIYNFFCQS